MKINVLVKLLALLELTIMIKDFDLVMLATTLLMLLSLLNFLQASQLIQVYKRLRWFVLATLVIYAFNIPGEYISFWPDNWQIAPTYEGIHAGLLQVSRLSVVVLALSVLLASTAREVLIGGLYTLFRPLKLLGLNHERFAVRLWLTLHYVEYNTTHQAQSLHKPNLFKQLFDQFDEVSPVEIGHANLAENNVISSIQLHIYPLQWLDKILLLILMGVILLSLSKPPSW